MKKIMSSIALAVLAMALVMMTLMTMTSCMSVNFGKGDVDKTPTQVPQIGQVTAMNQFLGVDVGGPFKVFYEQGDRHTVRIEAGEQAFKEMTVYVKDHELRIRKAVWRPTVSFKDVKVFVTSPNLQDIELAGSGMFAAQQRVTQPDMLEVEIAGSGKVLLADVACQSAMLEIAGSGNIEFGHLECVNATTEIAGSGNINLGSMKCQSLQIEIAGSGDVNCDDINADKVHTEVAGSGNVNLKGVVRNHSKDIAGSGKVNIISTPAPVNQ